MKIFSRVILVVLLTAAIASGLWWFTAGQHEKEYNGVFVYGHLYQTIEENQTGGAKTSIS